MGTKETERVETEGKETGAKETGVKDEGDGSEGEGREGDGRKATRAKAPGAQDNRETGGKGDMLMCERDRDNILSGDTTAGLNATEGIRRKSYLRM